MSDKTFQSSGARAPFQLALLIILCAACAMAITPTANSASSPRVFSAGDAHAGRETVFEPAAMDARPAQEGATAQSEVAFAGEPPLPAERGAWLILIRTSGGMRGRGMGNRAINSQGVIAYSASGSNPRYAAGEPVPVESLRRIERAVRAVNLSQWRERYFQPNNPYGCCDQINFSLELRRRTVNGMQQRFRTAWYSGSANLRPRDLAELYDAAMSIRRNAAQN